TQSANKQIPIMEKVLNDPENKNHEQVIKAAFGAHPNFDLNVVKENVQHLKNGRVLVDLEADTTIKDSIGFTSYDKAVPKRNPTFVKFSTNYYKPCALPKAAVAKTNKSAPKSAVEAGKEAMSLTAKHVGSRSKPSGASSEKPSEKSKLSPSVQGPGKSRSAARSKPATKLSSRPSNSRSRESPKAIPASKRLAKAATASRSRAAPRPKALAKKSMSPAPRPTS
ncbi:hypothetical protein K443DRAFT_42173, partial [Laccaria amethystina LaAM-08-1]